MCKTLYFEGAGWSKAIKGYSDIPNCRIRTAFTNNDGKKIYLEILADEVRKKDFRSSWLTYPPGTPIAFVDSCHYITDDPKIDDCNNSRIYYSDGKSIERNHESVFIFTYENLLKFVNEKLNCSFEKTEVLNELTGYWVFNDKGKHGTFSFYNFGDEFNYDAEKTAKRLAKRDELRAYFEQFMEYDNASYWTDENGDLVVRINTYEEVFKKMKFKERQFTIKI